jgi:heat shock protein HslJ
MKAFFTIVMTAILFWACSPTKKIPPVTTTVDTRPKVVTPVVIEKPVSKPVIASNPGMKMASINGKWRFEWSSEKDFMPMAGKPMPEISFNETDRKVTGFTGCNRFDGFFFTMGEQFNFSPLAVDKKSCTDVTVEKYITTFFRMVGAYKTQGNKVYLIHKNDRSRYIVFTK